jgi:NADH-quinone oxidoreductase subunit G
MAIIYIDNKPYEVQDGQNLLHAGLSLGFNIPYFCWHPALGSVGACRQCAVKQFKDQNDTKGRIVMSCMTPALDGTRISIDDPEAKAFRASVIEWLMLNHPHDCPICDEGGECHLQDMTVMTGHAYRRNRFKKRTYRNQNLGPYINHEMNRCIQCYRCVRFYRDYAGGRDLDVFGAHDHLYFGRQQDGPLESQFSGNLVEICPTGVFTDKTLKEHYTRKWDLQTAPSICTQCGLGCNTLPGERYGQLRRIRNRYHHEVNGYFLCDRGRYGYEFVNGAQRIRQPLSKKGTENSAQPITKEAALTNIASNIKDKGKLIGIGSPRASLEANFALRQLVGAERFYAGVSDSELQLLSAMTKIMRTGPARSPSLRDVSQADAVFVLGDDVSQVAPLLELALRQSVRQQPMRKLATYIVPRWDDGAVRQVLQDEKGPLFIATPKDTALDELASEIYHAEPDELAHLGFAVAHAIDAEAPSVPGLSAKMRSLAEKIATALKTAERPLIISGPSCGSLAIIQAAANIAWALCRQQRPAELCFTMPECNSLGLALMTDQSLDAAAKAANDGKAETIVILENELYARTEEKIIDQFLVAAKHVIVLDHSTNRTTEKAELVLPAATFAESAGTMVNNEGRAQRFYQVFVPHGEIQASWQWLYEIMKASGNFDSISWSDWDSLVKAIAVDLPIFGPIAEIAPVANWLSAGQKIARQPHRYSGRTAMQAQISVHEPKPPEDLNSPLAFSMEGSPLQPPAALLTHYWSPGWNSVQALNRFQEEVGGPLRNGEGGKRLMEPNRIERVAYFNLPHP